jgi:putative peptidoglycan lipid II flippase
MTFISRIAGFGRDVVLANIFGAGPAFDAYVVASKIPNFLRRLFAEGAFSQAFIPLLAEHKEKKSHEEVQQFVNRVFGTLASTVFFVVILAEILAPLLVLIFAPGFMRDPVRFQYTENMLRIMFPYLWLITMAAFCGAVLNTYGRFMAAASSGIFLNVVIILVVGLWAPYLHITIYVLAWGVLLGGIGQLLVQLIPLRRLNLFPKPKLGFRDPEVKRVMKMMIPALFGVSVAQISLIFDNFFASFLPMGSISWLYFSDRIIFLPLGVIGVALSTVVMPYLSRHYSAKDFDLYSHTLDWALRCVAFIGLPSAVALFVLAGPILATLMHHGAFNTRDVLMTSQSLMAYAIGLPSFMLVKILASAFYSRQNISTPVKIAVISVVVSVVFNLLLILPLKHAGLALSTALASIVNSLLLLVLLLKNKFYSPYCNWKIFSLRMLIANAVMATLLLVLAGKINWWLIASTFSRISYLTLIIVGGLVIYLATLFLTGMRLRDFNPPG